LFILSMPSFLQDLGLWWKIPVNRQRMHKSGSLLNFSFEWSICSNFQMFECFEISENNDRGSPFICAFRYQGWGKMVLCRPFFTPICLWRRHVFAKWNHGIFLGLPLKNYLMHYFITRYVSWSSI
jgi:hypothetical protein